MKKVLATIFGLSLVIGLLVFITRYSSPQRDASSVNNPEKSSATAGENASEQRATKLSPKASKGDASGGVAPKRPVVHVGTDFAFGENENLKIVDGVLQLGDDAKFVPRLMPYKIFGIHISAEHSADTAFDHVIPDLDMSLGEHSELTFEIRSKKADGTWSVWEEVPRGAKKAVRLESPAVSWQYRLTFYANDPAQSPKVRSVSVMADETLISPDPDATFSASNSQ